MPSKFIGTNFKPSIQKLSSYEKMKLQAKKQREKKKEREILIKAKKKEKRENHLPTLIKKLDTIFSLYIRNKFKNQDGTVTCFTCYNRHPLKEIQNGHYVRRANMNTRFDERNCRPQCFKCNVWYRGNYAQFTDHLLEIYGEEWLRELIADGRKIKKWTSQELKDLIKFYQEKIV